MALSGTMAGCLGSFQEESGTTSTQQPATATKTPTPTASPTPTATQTPTPTATPEPDNPWDKLPIVVGLNREVSGSRNLNQRMRESLRYWEREAETYTPYSDVEFVYRPNADSLDIEVNVVRRISSCGEHDTDAQIVGCAPLLTERARVSSTESVRIIGELEGRSLRHTIKHEFGHLLGLDHDDEPQEVMSYDPSLRIPNYDEKVQILERYNSGYQTFIDAGDRYGDGSDLYSNREYERAAPIFYEAADLAQSARSDFVTAENVAVSIDQQEVEEICDEAGRKSARAQESFTQIGRASEYYAAGDKRNGDESIEQHQTAHRQMQNLDARPPAVVRDELGLPS